jgi:hypothetical protein
VKIPRLILVDRIEPKANAYILPGQFPTKSGITRAWLLGSRLRSVQQTGGGILKDRSVFEDHQQPEAMEELIREFQEHGAGQPSSYADAFFKRFFAPMTPYAFRRIFPGGVRGGWQAQLMPNGTYGGQWYRYDLQSAYLWSGLQGLPEVKRFRVAEYIGRKPGVFLCDVLPNLKAPAPYYFGGTLLVTPREIELYALTVTRVHRGLTYPAGAWIDPEPMMRAIQQWSFWKSVGRSYWGRWASEMPVTCETWKSGLKRTTRDLNNPFYNPLWAHLVVSRVRERLWLACQNRRVARVYVDSLITDTPLETGQGLGDWRQEQEYCGIRIAGLNSVVPLTRAVA